MKLALIKQISGFLTDVFILYTFFMVVLIVAAFLIEKERVALIALGFAFVVKALEILAMFIAGKLGGKNDKD